MEQTHAEHSSVVVLLGLPGDADPGLAAGAAVRRASVPVGRHGGHRALHAAAARGGHAGRLGGGSRGPRLLRSLPGKGYQPSVSIDHSGARRSDEVRLIEVNMRASRVPVVRERERISDRDGIPPPPPHLSL